MELEYLLQFFTRPLFIEFIVLAVAALCLLFYQVYINRAYYLRTTRYQRTQSACDVADTAGFLPASIIVYACDNAESLRRNIPILFNQDYPDFEVVVVDDASIDDTREVLQQLMRQYSRLYVTYVPSDAKALSRKKLALTLGLKAAKNDHVVMLEAACVPDTSLWLRRIMARFDENIDVVLGYTHLSFPETFYGRYMAYDRLLFSLRYLSCAVRRRPFMGEGTNLAYKKSLFFERKGFIKTLNFRYGDDDLFVNEVSNRTNTAVEISPESFVSVASEDTAFWWRLLKLKYRFTARCLRGRQQTLFAIEQCGVYLFYAMLVGMVICQPMHPIVPLTALMLLALRIMLQVITYRKVTLAFGENKLAWRVLLYEWIRPIVNGYYWWLSHHRREENKTWISSKI